MGGRQSKRVEESDRENLTAVAPELYQLEESSFAGEAVYGDIIRVHQMSDGALLFREIAERSTLTTQSWILSERVLATERISRVLAKVIDAAGMWEQAFGGMLIVHTPPGLAKAIFDEITQASSKA